MAYAIKARPNGVRARRDEEAQYRLVMAVAFAVFWLVRSWSAWFLPAGAGFRRRSRNPSWRKHVQLHTVACHLPL